MKRKELGVLGEKLAKDFLKKRKYHILETNFRCPEGELDIIAKKDDYLVFVEVRTKASSSFGTPEESITSTKKEKLITSALSYLSSHPKEQGLWRIDVIAIDTDEKGKPSRIELIENALGS